MGIKVVRRSQVIFHAIFLVLFSLIFHYLVKVILSKNSLLNLEMVLDYSKQNIFLVIGASVCILAIFLGKRASYYFCLLLSLAVLTSFVFDYTATNNKGILLAGFVYFICSYFILLSLRYEFDSPPFSPGFSVHQIDNRLVPKIEVNGIDESGREYKGFLTKIAEDAFFTLDEQDSKIKGKLTANIKYEGKQFECLALEVTRGNNGRGFRVGEDKSTSPFSWYNFYTLLKDRGYYLD